MCMGGRQPRATITMPDYGSYDRMFDMQKDAVMSQINGETQALQQQVTNSLASINDVKGKIADFQVKKADSQKALQEEATRLSVLMGPPPPEATAQAPEVGTRDRGINTRKGKSSLRIGRKTAKGSAKGTGLNIT